MWNILVMFSLVVYVNADMPILWVNSLDTEMNMTRSGPNTEIGTYYFYENEVALINCTRTKTGMIKLEVKDEPNLMNYANRNQIIMYMRMTAGSEDKYVDCYLKDSYELSVARIFLKPMKNEDQNIWKVEVNGKIYPQRNNIINYNYVRGDLLSVSCTKNGDSEISGAFKKFTDSSIQRPFDDLCPNNKNDPINIIFNHINTEGLQGLPSTGLLYHYTDCTGRLVMHYEYDKEVFYLMWEVLAVAGNLNIFHVAWKGVILASTQVRMPLRNVVLMLKIPEIRPTYEDDRTTINLLMSNVGHRSSIDKYIQIILRRKSNDVKHFEDIKETLHCGAADIYIAVSVGAVVFLILLVLGTWWIRRELGAYVKESSELSNDTIVKDEVIPTSAELYTYVDTDKVRLYHSKARPMDKNNAMVENNSATMEQIYSYVEKCESRDTKK